MAYRLRFGGFDFPRTLMPASIDSPGDIGEQERPRADGSTQQPLRRKARTANIEGAVTVASADAVQAALDSIKQAVLTPGAQALWFGRDDRFVNAQCETYTDDYGGGTLYGNLARVTIGFKAADPFFYATTPTSATLSATGGTVANRGEASALPVWTITVAAAGTGPLVLANTSTGEVVSVAGPFGAGDVVSLDRTAYTVTVNGVSVFGRVIGRIPMLQAGSNSVSVAAAGTATVSGAVCVFVTRWF